MPAVRLSAGPGPDASLSLAQRGTVAVGLSGQDPIRDRLSFLQPGSVDEQPNALFPDLAEEAGRLVPPDDARVLELARNGFGVRVRVGTEVDRVNVVGHGTSTAARSGAAAAARSSPSRASSRPWRCCSH